MPGKLKEYLKEGRNKALDLTESIAIRTKKYLMVRPTLLSLNSHKKHMVSC